MVEADGLRGVEAVEVNQFPPGGRIDEARAVAPRQVEHELEAIHQDVLLQFGNDPLWRDSTCNRLRSRRGRGRFA